MPRGPWRPLFCGLCAAALLLPVSARADAIDGHWCGPEKRILSIQGPAITTPGGKQIKGIYERHAFSYTVPEGEAGSGGTVAMVLVSEQMMRLRPATGGAEQVWRRCEATVS